MTQKNVDLNMRFDNPHDRLDEHYSLRRHHLAKKEFRERQIDLLPLGQNARVLDIGIGPGLYLEYMLSKSANLGCEFTLVDHSQSALDECLLIARSSQHGRGRVATINDDLFSLTQVPNDRFDLIFIGNTIEYVKAPVAWLKSVVLPKLRKGGHLVIRDLDCSIQGCNYADPVLTHKIIQSRIASCDDLEVATGIHHNPFIGRFLGRILTESGLSLERLVPFMCEFKAPLSSWQIAYVSFIQSTWYLEDRKKTLTHDDKRRWLSIFSQETPTCALEMPDFYYFETEYLSIGRK